MARNRRDDEFHIEQGPTLSEQLRRAAADLKRLMRQLLIQTYQLGQLNPDSHEYRRRRARTVKLMREIETVQNSWTALSVRKALDEERSWAAAQFRQLLNPIGTTSDDVQTRLDRVHNEIVAAMRAMQGRGD